MTSIAGRSTKLPARIPSGSNGSSSGVGRRRFGATADTAESLVRAVVAPLVDAVGVEVVLVVEAILESPGAVLVRGFWRRCADGTPLRERVGTAGTAVADFWSSGSWVALPCVLRELLDRNPVVPAPNPGRLPNVGT